MKRAQPEHAAQVAIVEYLLLRGFWAVHVPNGGKLFGDARQRARTSHFLKVSGMCPGFPDLMVIHTEGRIGFIEVKAEGAYQQPAQRECQQRLADLGHHYAVCRYIEDVEDTLIAWRWVTPIVGPDGEKLRPVSIGRAA